jgi:small subunit ribosomal protein S18
MSEEKSTPTEEKVSTGREFTNTPPAEGRFKARRRKKVSYLTINKITHVDYKDIQILRRFINEHGKIVSSRQSGATAKQQRMVSEAIKRAREMALLPFVTRELVDRYNPAARRPYEYSRYRSDAQAKTSETAAPRKEQTEA